MNFIVNHFKFTNLQLVKGSNTQNLKLSFINLSGFENHVTFIYIFNEIGLIHNNTCLGNTVCRLVLHHTRPYNTGAATVYWLWLWAWNRQVANLITYQCIAGGPLSKGLNLNPFICMSVMGQMQRMSYHPAVQWQ